MSEPKDKQEPDGPNVPIPAAVINRLSLYLRELQHLVREGSETISSNQLGPRLGFTDAQVRKDLAYFGQFGYPGIGYRCQELIDAIRKILATDREWRVALIGTGNLGRALLGYRGFASQGFKVVAAFDIDERKVGSEIEGVPVYHLDRLREIVADMGIRLAIIAVPATAAQTVADRVGETAIDGVVNFAPVTIQLREGISKVGVDLAIEMEQLSFSVANRTRSP